MVPDPGYPETPNRVLTFAESFAIHLEVPDPVHQEYRQLRKLFMLCGGARLRITLRGGDWDFHPPPPDLSIDFRAGVQGILRGMGVPAPAAALVFEHDEYSLASTLILLFMWAAWKVPDDVFMFPETGDLIVHFDHDRLVHVNCASRAKRSWALSQLDGAD